MIEPSNVTSLDEEFWTIWRKVRPLLAKALERSDEYSLGDVLHFAYEGTWDMWHGDNSVAFTRLARYPQHTALVIILAAGELEEIVQLEPHVVAWGKQQGCKYVEVYGRRGWARALPGYDEQATVYRKVLQ